MDLYLERRSTSDKQVYNRRYLYADHISLEIEMLGGIDEYAQILLPQWLYNNIARDEARRIMKPVFLGYGPPDPEELKGIRQTFKMSTEFKAWRELVQACGDEARAYFSEASPGRGSVLTTVRVDSCTHGGSNEYPMYFTEEQIKYMLLLRAAQQTAHIRWTQHVETFALRAIYRAREKWEREQGKKSTVTPPQAPPALDVRR